jgi:hypothetical protein
MWENRTFVCQEIVEIYGRLYSFTLGEFKKTTFHDGSGA